MSVKWMDDPSYYGSAVIASRYSTHAGVNPSSGNGRFGGYSWRTTNNYNITPSLGTLVTGTIGISFRINSSISLSGSNVSLVGFYDGVGANEQVDVRMNAAGNLLCTRSGTQIGSTSSFAATPGVWYRLEFQATIDPTNGSIQVRINGVAVIGPTSGLNTRATTNTSFNMLFFGCLAGGYSAGSADFNDFAGTDSNSPNAGFLGDKRCYLLLPNADSSVQFTNNWASFQNAHTYPLGDQFKDSNGNVQECTTPGTSQSSGTPTWATSGGSTTVSGGATFTCRGSGANPGAHNWMAVTELNTDGDDSYNSSSTAGQQDLFTVPSLPAGAQNIAAVDNILYVRKDDAGTARTIEGLIKSGTTTQAGPSLSLSTSYQFLDQIQETDPNTSAGWTVSGVNNMLCGYEEVA